jgi:hypothetical protein
MSHDEPPLRLAILGAGPIGIEAALYGRYLGYDVSVYEKGRVAEHLRQWGHVRMFSPFSMNVSPLGLAALEAQEPGWKPPPPDALVTGRELAEGYTIPLSESDLLDGCIHPGVEVLYVGRDGMLKGEQSGAESRNDNDFRILLRDERGKERIVSAEVVIDATGTFGQHNWLGRGGIPALGELSAAELVDYALPDVLGKDRGRFAGRHTLVVGAGYSAATNVVCLAELAQAVLGTRITWAVRQPKRNAPFPMRLIADDPLSERDRLSRRANEWAAAGDAALLDDTTVHAIHWQPRDERFHVEFIGSHAGRAEFDRVIANVGFHPDSRLYSELLIHECYASQGPMKLAAELAGHASADCLRQPHTPRGSLLNPEPDFYILGAKSYGRNPHFLLSIGLAQVRDVFSIIGERDELDLYATFRRTAS